MFYLLGNYSEHGEPSIQWVLTEKNGVFELQTINIDSLGALEKMFEVLDIKIEMNKDDYRVFQYRVDSPKPFEAAKLYSSELAFNISKGQYIDIPIGYQEGFPLANCYHC